MTWVLLLVLCSVPSDASSCEDLVLAHNLSEAECRSLAERRLAPGQIMECVRETHAVFEGADDHPDQHKLRSWEE